MKWLNDSEVYTGLLLEGKQGIGAAPADKFHPPYDKVVKMLKEGHDREDIMIALGGEAVNTALMAAHSYNGLGESADWSKILEKGYVNYHAGKKLGKIANKLTYGEQVDWAIVSDLVYRARQAHIDEFIKMSEIEEGEFPFIPSGWDALDTHLGGLPKVGMLLVTGPPGSGKTTFAGKSSTEFAKYHTDKNVAIFSLEMMASEYVQRVRETNNTSDIEDRIYIRDLPATPEEVIYKASSIGDVGLIIVDFADLMIKGETSESAMGHIYRTLSMGVKEADLQCPIMVLAHPNRSYRGGILRPYHTRYSGLAENLSWMIITLYNPNIDFFAEEDEEILPIIPDVAYACVWKIRGGFRKHLDDSPGAIAIPFRGDKGWHSNSLKGSRGWWSLKELV